MIWLIAEDEADIRNLVAMMCTVWGHTPLPFDSGHSAWNFLDKVEAGTYDSPLPDFALMDIRMPGPRGNEIAKRIRSLEPLKNMPIVLMTAFVLSEDERAEMLASSGVDQIINKPLPDFEDLRKLLDGVIEKRQSAQDAGQPAPAEVPAAPPPPAAPPVPSTSAPPASPAPPSAPPAPSVTPAAPSPAPPDPPAVQPPVSNTPPAPRPPSPPAGTGPTQSEPRPASDPGTKASPDDSSSSQDKPL